MKRLSVVVLLALTACATQPATLPPPVPAGPGIVVDTQPVPLNPRDPAQTAIGDFTYAGGLVLTTKQSSRLHGLSDLVVDTKGKITAVTDQGDLFQATLTLDAAGRLGGVKDATLKVLNWLDGEPLAGKHLSDAEGVALLANGDMLVSFEQEHRIWRYPADGSPPKVAPSPPGPFKPNDGMEALAADPAAGADAYVVGVEDTGQTWTCKLSAACVASAKYDLPATFGLVAINRLPGGRTAYLLRNFIPGQGNRLILRITGGGQESEMVLARPLTEDNFEGIAAVPSPGGGWRFYLLADDNFQSSQRTLLLAFDWRPQEETKP